MSTNMLTQVLGNLSGSKYVRSTNRDSGTMKATVFHAPNDIRVEEVARPRAGAGEAVIRITLTTICGTDLHILRGEYAVKPGLVIGHEPVGVIEELGPGVTGYKPGDRVLVGAITPCGQCHGCLSGHLSQCGHGHGYEAIGGWRFGNTIHGAQAEYLIVPNAQANMAKVPDELRDEEVVLLADIASTGFSGAESGQVRIGDSVVVLAQGPIGLCYDAFAAGLGDHRIVTTLCPGGKERMRRLLEVVRQGRVDLTPLLTHTFPLARIREGYSLFGERR